MQKMIELSIVKKELVLPIRATFAFELASPIEFEHCSAQKARIHRLKRRQTPQSDDIFLLLC